MILKISLILLACSGFIIPVLAEPRLLQFERHKGILLHNYTDRKSKATRCSDFECTQICGLDDLCSASEFDAANQMCTMIFCNEVQLIDKESATVSLKSIFSTFYNIDIFERSFRYIVGLCGMVGYYFKKLYYFFKGRLQRA